MDAGIDPPYGDESSVYADYYDEIENRAPIKTNHDGQFVHDPHFRLDNAKVWSLLFGILLGSLRDKHESKTLYLDQNLSQ